MPIAVFSFPTRWYQDVSHSVQGDRISNRIDPSMVGSIRVSISIVNLDPGSSVVITARLTQVDHDTCVVNRVWDEVGDFLVGFSRTDIDNLTDLTATFEVVGRVRLGGDITIYAKGEAIE